MSKLTENVQPTKKICEICDWCEEEPCRIDTNDYCPQCDRLLDWVDEVIEGKGEMVFSDEVPTFNSLQEYMEHVGTIREVLRQEQRKRARR